ncbi:hypothetical protein [Deinococcus ruber]|uniref:Uncharacterized protein n=1 Tax=Deinococcus ruber TaxID=1848197 RepID=A0A918C494_9DEIO|nr:hypothetical protein [Deinococcus ruber]GGR06416.1 hypothetical protein GCM10008957_19020 [Deinococcus ruber]
MHETRTNDALAPPLAESVFVVRQHSATHWQVSVYLPDTGQRLYFASLASLLAYLSARLGPDSSSETPPIQS